MDKKNIFVIGFVFGKKYSEMVFFIFLLDFVVNKEVNFLKYLIYLGVNRGRG